MERGQIKYRSGYKYQLAETYSIHTPIKPEQDIDTTFLKLSKEGVLIIAEGYAWDGPSKAFDTRNFMRGSLVHDALYQLMREGYLSQDFRLQADEILQEICLTDGMYWIRAAWVFAGVHEAGARFATKEAISPVLVAPLI